MRPTVELWDHVGLGTIIEFPSGVDYSNQTGGTSCLHPSMEGVFVPLRNDCAEDTRELLSPEHALRAYFLGPKWKGSGATKGIDPEDADFIERVLAQHQLSCIVVNRFQLAESHEAWVHISITAEEDDRVPIFHGFGPYPRAGILTWANTD